MTHNHKYKILNKKEENRILDLEIEIDYSETDGFNMQALKNLSTDLEIKGFRKGAVPEKMAREIIGELKIFEESAILLIEHLLPEIIIQEKIEYITDPKINIKKIAPKNNLLLEVKFILMPEIEIADYKKIASSEKKEEVKIEDKEIEDYIDYIRKMRAEAESIKKKTSDKKEEREEVKNQEIKLPEFNDEFVKTLGNFKNTEDFKTQLKENMLKEKEVQAQQKRRLSIMEKIIDESKINLPEILVEEELDKMMMQFKNDISSMKMSPEDYLKEIKKTEDDLRKEWHTDAIKRAKMNIIIGTIAKAEKIKPNEEDVNHQAEHLSEHHRVDINRAKIYVEMVLTNEEVFKFLEKIN